LVFVSKLTRVENIAVGISKKGKKKLKYQTPWYEDDAKQVVGGLVEFSIILPDEMPHYDRG